MLLTREKGWIGVDIGTHSVKLAQVERRAGGFALSEAVIIQRFDPWVDMDSESLKTRDSVEELVAGRTLGERFVGRTTATALPMAICQLKSLQVADGSDEARRAAVAAELRSNPVAGGRAREFDYWPIDNPLENATIVRENVSVLSIASDWAQRLVADHEAAKLCCQTLDGIPLALGRAVSMCDRVDTSRPVAVLDWGFARTTFCIVLNDRPLFVRCLRDCEYGAVIRVLRDDLGLTWDEARQVAVQHAASASDQPGDDDDLQRLVTEITAPVMSQLVSELERTLVYLRMHRGKLLPQQLWLFGGGAVVNGIAPWLRHRANLDVHCWDLGESSFGSPSAGQSPVAMLGPAIALSALAWEVA